MRIHFVIITVLVLSASNTVWAEPAERQSTSSSTSPLHDSTVEEKKQALADTLAQISDVYVDQIHVDKIVRHISSINARQPYHLLKDDAAFTEKLTRDLREVSGDGHLYLRTKAAMGEGHRRMMRRRPDGEGEVSMPTDHLDSKVLANNVGYLNIRAFGISSEALDEIDQEMDRLKDTRALVLDLRECRGGAIPAVDRLLNYLTNKSVHFLTSVNAMAGLTMQRYTHPEEAGFYYAQPVFVLLSDRTFSAGEDFAYSIQLMRLGTLIGKSTRGGGYMNAMFPLNDKMVLSVSIGKTFDPKTSQGWQGTGISADIEIPEEDALDHALGLIGSAPRLSNSARIRSPSG